jgi:putative heme-binding domain-containing protein
MNLSAQLFSFRGACRALVSLCLLAVLSTAATAQTLKLEKGDHLCLVGNTLAERMQHYGWLEARLHARFPQHELVVRNLGYSGDELTVRLRSKDFGTPDQWLAGSAPIPQPDKLNPDAPVRQNRFELTNTKADVIFAFFGYNESFAGEAGLAAFKTALSAQLDHWAGQKYNGKSAPRVVLFSPIAHEDLNDVNLPSGAENNARLALYTAAMAEVAKAKEVTFVDLFALSKQAYDQSQEPLTINGIHLNERGDALIAAAIERALFPAADSPAKDESLEALRKAVVDKNFCWFHRYRTTDGFSVYGDRAFLRFTGGQSNYEVGQRELEVLDLQTSNRDTQIWAVAQGKKVELADTNLPGFVPVVTNKPGSLEGGKHLFLEGEAAISRMTLGKNLKVQLFASEELFPELISPVQMAFDPRGRLWVATWPTYPHWKPTEPMNDALLILEDTNGDGRADKCTPFASDLHNPTGFEFWNGGVLVARGPDVLFLKDTNGDDKADVRETVLHGLDTADTHHTANSFTLDPGGALYFQEGTFHHSQVETPWGAARRVANGAVFRYEPRTHKFDIYVSHGFANPHGHVFDRWGQDIVIDGTGAVPYHGALFSGHVNFPNKHARPPQVYQQRTRPCPGLEILSSSHFPEEQRGNLLVPNVIGLQGILQYKIDDTGSSLTATEVEPILVSSDPNFRPSDVEVGPDGAIYFTDWQNPIIGHMQHNLRDPSRDRIHGRVYRITYEERGLVQPPAVTAQQSIPQLLEILKHPDDRVRYRARLELGARKSTDVIVAANKWYTELDKQDKNHEHHLLEALWLHQQHNVVDLPLLKRMLASPEFRARAAAVRVLCYWRDRVPETMPLLFAAAADEHPKVRLEAVRAASFLTTPEAMEIALVAAELPSDDKLAFVQSETMKTLKPIVDQAAASGQKIAFKTPAGARYFLKNLKTEDLLKEPRTREVYNELLFRPGLRDEQRREAVQGLANLDQKPEFRVVMESISHLDRVGANVDSSVVFDLVRLLTSRTAAELATARGELERLATSAQQPLLRQIGYVSLMQVDGNTDKAWKLAASDVRRLQDFVNAVPLISDLGVKASLYEQLVPLLKELPANLADPKHAAKGTVGRYVRLELPRRGTLTLAEVEVMSGERNVARQGKASQKNTAHGGPAERALDGNKDTSYGGGGQTHTQENTENPWWEVDLGDEYAIDAIVIYNRDDGLGNRLEGFTLTVLDSQRGEVWKQEKIPAPKSNSKLEVGGAGLAGIIRHATMQALTQVRGQEARTFGLLQPFVKSPDDRLAAIRALQRLPQASWPKDAAPEVLGQVTTYIKSVPVADRTSPAALDALEFANGLANLLPADDAKRARQELSELGVRVVRLGTIFEKMSFDKDVIAVRAGKPVDFILENTDLMPHNFVIVKPGKLEEVGLWAEANSQNPEFAAKQFVPQLPHVLAGSKLLQPRDAQRLSFVAPTKPGVYPFVCTYPGHWRRMYGALYVVDDLDAYEASPEAYLASVKLEPADPLLADRRPRTEWKLADLAPAVEQMKNGRSYSAGRQLFAVASCIACHQVDKQGNPFGPDLAKLDAKLQSVDILKEILDPSAKINEKFQTVSLLMTDGKVRTGLVLEESADSLKLIENPLARVEPVTINKSDIEERQKSPNSLMPKGLLDKLTKDEILDLVAFITARGNQKHPLFQGGGHDHAGHGGHGH